MILLIHTSVCKFIHCHSSLALRKWISSGSPEASWSRWASRCCPSEFLPECQSFCNSLAPSLLLSSYSDPFFLPHFPLFPTLAALWRPHFIEKQKKTISQNKTVSPAIFLNLFFLKFVKKFSYSTSCHSENLNSGATEIWREDPVFLR